MNAREQNKYFLAQLKQSLQERPIRLFETSSLALGWSWTWRYVVLWGPIVALGFVAEELKLGPPPAAGVILLVIAAFAYMFFAVGLAEGWRAADIAKPFAGALKRGFELFGFIVNSAFRLLWIPLLLGLAAGALDAEEAAVDVLSVVVGALMLVPGAGRGIQVRYRFQEIIGDHRGAAQQL